MEEFRPRQLPLRERIPSRLWRVEAGKEKEKSKGGRKWVFGLLMGTVLLSLGFWLWGNFSGGKSNQLPGKPIVAFPLPTPTPVPKKTTEVTNKIGDLTKNLKGTYGVYGFNLTNKKDYGVLESQTFPAASLIKLPVLLTLYQETEAGRVDLSTKYILKNSDKQTGAGSMQYKPAGTVYTYRKMAELAGKQSDNTAFHVIRKILGDQKIQETIDKLGMSKTSLSKNETSPADMGLFFRKLYAGSIVSRDHRDEILDYLTETFDESRIPAGVPEGTKVSHKVGTDIGIISDGGIVFADQPFILVIMSKNALEKEAKEALPKITQAIWEFETKP